MNLFTLTRDNVMRLLFFTIHLSSNDSYVATRCFVALSGLFAAFVTVNLVTLKATAVFSLNGAALKLIALPVFCIVGFASHLAIAAAVLTFVVSCSSAAAVYIAAPVMAFVVLVFVAAIALSADATEVDAA